ncbi:MFS transporter [Chitinimonas sp.]|uniref:MFS transporter n=1 Tax=Chitinimonas sp. TaxID=1934313 RepID=UPI0035AFD6C5
MNMQSNRARWRGIVALTAVSCAAQIGQFGIAFVLYPLALSARGGAPWQLGLVGGALWAGMAAGLLLAPRLIRRHGHGATVGAGLLVSGLALLLSPSLPTSSWVALAFACGLGMGLRWIGNETWLYDILPEKARGRLVGLHETLLGIAAVLGPVLIGWLDAAGSRIFVVAAAFCLLAALPLYLARAYRVPAHADHESASSFAAWLRGLARPGALIAGLGGLMEGALLGLFAAYAGWRGLDTAQAAWLLSAYGAGAMLLQFPLGWLVDHRGLRVGTVVTAVLTAVCAVLLWPGLCNGWTLGALMFVFGGAQAGFLTLGMIAATDGLGGAEMAGEVSRVSLAYSGLSALGAPLVGLLISASSGAALLVFTVIVALLLATLVQRHPQLRSSVAAS